MRAPIVFPFYLQYEVRPTSSNTAVTFVGAIATVIVFAETEALARARAARHVAREAFEIIEVKRAMLVSQHHVTHMDGVLKKVYMKAEQAGIAAIIDGWQANR